MKSSKSSIYQNWLQYGIVSLMRCWAHKIFLSAVLTPHTVRNVHLNSLINGVSSTFFLSSSSTSHLSLTLSSLNILSKNVRDTDERFEIWAADNFSKLKSTSGTINSAQEKNPHNSSLTSVVVIWSYQRNLRLKARKVEMFLSQSIWNPILFSSWSWS